MLDLASNGKENHNLLYIKANAYLAKGRLDLAESLYLKLLLINEIEDSLDLETHADIFHNLGMIAERRLKNDSAIDYYKKAVERNSKRSMTWIFLAKLYFTRYELTGNELDHKAGINALNSAEETNFTYPIIGILKAKYAIS
jgi:tetratricopeptide (TPR) repeat protein